MYIFLDSKDEICFTHAPKCAIFTWLYLNGSSSMYIAARGYPGTIVYVHLVQSLLNVLLALDAHLFTCIHLWLVWLSY